MGANAQIFFSGRPYVRTILGMSFWPLNVGGACVFVYEKLERGVGTALSNVIFRTRTTVV